MHAAASFRPLVLGIALALFAMPENAAAVSDGEKAALREDAAEFGDNFSCCRSGASSTTTSGSPPDGRCPPEPIPPIRSRFRRSAPTHGGASPVTDGTIRDPAANRAGIRSARLSRISPAWRERTRPSSPAGSSHRRITCRMTWRPISLWRSRRCSPASANTAGIRSLTVAARRTAISPKDETFTKAPARTATTRMAGPGSLENSATGPPWAGLHGTVGTGAAQDTQWRSRRGHAGRSLSEWRSDRRSALLPSDTRSGREINLRADRRQGPGRLAARSGA